MWETSVALRKCFISYGIVFSILFKITSGCILLLNGWEPLSVQDKALLADIVVTGSVRNAYKNIRTSADTYSIEFQIANVLKGKKMLETIKIDPKLPNVYNISNFGDRIMCYADVNPGDNHILFLTTFGGRLSAKYDDIFGAAGAYNLQNEEYVLETLGWKGWSSWSRCSTTCHKGYQTRKRKCMREKPCEGQGSESRECNGFPCKGAIDLLSALSLSSLPSGVTVPEERPSAYRLEANAKINLPTSKLFPEFFPPDFSVIITAKPEKNNAGYVFTVSDLMGRVNIGIEVGNNPIFYYSDKNNMPATRSPKFSVNLSDGQWHQFAFSVRGQSVTLYLDCILQRTKQLERSSIPNIGVKTVTGVGSAFGDKIKKHFVGEIEQLTIIGDPDAARLQCNNEQSDNVIRLAPSNNIDPVDNDRVPNEEGRGGKRRRRNRKRKFRWSSWSPCSVTCGRGEKSRTAFCLDNAVTVDECLGPKRKKVQIRRCKMSSCPNKCSPECLHGGKCNKRGKCKCTLGYSGVQCQTVACRVRCQNGGYCNEPNICTCLPGYTGEKCETPVCENECMNGGRCIAPNKCSCPHGTLPPLCKAACTSPCYNGGSCHGNNICKCLPGYSGNQCQTAVCEQGCVNGGSCIAPNTCSCPHGYTGSDCSQHTCTPMCLNGGRCVGPNQCQCPPGYTGHYCQTAFCSGGCQNGGVCIAPNTCACRDGFQGDMCERRKCRYQVCRQSYNRAFRRLQREVFSAPCGPWKRNTCTKTKLVYKTIYRIAFRPVYRCV
ncbi:unnamed protein product [Owenia fusiformis]|uniref:Wnt inhibitory factor 1 n=1 Tax=Owenia fusiformis TaxID=6347 RepID=A0A8S4N1H5_OWEFU|nr:unnamed protein product [Owenia fusiformis]